MVDIGGAREQGASNLDERKADGLTYFGLSPLHQGIIHLKNRPLSPSTFFDGQRFLLDSTILKILGWGLEDVYLATNVISRGVNVFRANDPNLVHLFHTKHCDPELSPQQYDGCLKECFSIIITIFVTIFVTKIVSVT